MRIPAAMGEAGRFDRTLARKMLGERGQVKISICSHLKVKLKWALCRVMRLLSMRKVQGLLRRPVSRLRERAN